MDKRRLNVPARLIVVALGASLGSCNDPQHNNTPPGLCPEEYQCSSDAARAFNCSDMAQVPYESDFGTCFPPI